MNLPSVGLHPFDTTLIPPDLKSLNRAPRRLMEVLLKGSPTPLETASKSWSLDFCLSPKKIISTTDCTPLVSACELERTSLSSAFEPKAHAEPTGQMEKIPASILFRSIGYKSEPLPGFSELRIPFDDRRGTILNDQLGRVVREVRDQGAALTQEPYPGLYCSGWVKRGPTGVIASTMADAFATGDAIVQDYGEKAPFLNGSEEETEKAGWQGVLNESSGALGARVVTWADWQKIDMAEQERGEKSGRERGKLTSIPSMLDVLS